MRSARKHQNGHARRAFHGPVLGAYLSVRGSQCTIEKPMKRRKRRRGRGRGGGAVSWAYGRFTACAGAQNRRQKSRLKQSKQFWGPTGLKPTRDKLHVAVEKTGSAYLSAENEPSQIEQKHPHFSARIGRWVYIQGDPPKSDPKRRVAERPRETGRRPPASPSPGGCREAAFPVGISDLALLS